MKHFSDKYSKKMDSGLITRTFMGDLIIGQLKFSLNGYTNLFSGDINSLIFILLKLKFSIF